MPFPYEATTKQLIELNPQDWLRFLGFSGENAQVVDADLATVTTDADRVLHILDTPERIVHIEFESGRDASRVPLRLLRYNTLLGYQHSLPVATVVVLLNPQASRIGEVNGLYEATHPDLGIYVTFRYVALRVWEIPVERVLTGGVATLPLALLSDTSGTEPTQIVSALVERIQSDATLEEDEKRIVFASAYIMAGLRYDAPVINLLFQGIQDMEESSTYQYILSRGIQQGLEQGIEQGLEQGLEQGNRRAILRIGSRRFGNPTAETVAAIESITTLARLTQLEDRLLEVETWDELLAG